MSDNKELDTLNEMFGKYIDNSVDSTNYYMNDLSAGDTTKISSATTTALNTTTAIGNITTWPNSITTTTSGTGTYTIPSTYTSPSVTLSSEDGRLVAEQEDIVEILTDLLDEMNVKYDKAEKQMEELVKMMKEHRENLAIYNATFQYYVGIKTALTEIIDKINRYIKDNSPEEERIEIV